jgi:hypothetical protein
VGLKRTALQRCGAFQNPAVQRCSVCPSLRPTSDVGRLRSDIGRPTSEVRCLSSWLWEELLRSRNKSDLTSNPLGVIPFSSDPILKSDVGSDRIFDFTY